MLNAQLHKLVLSNNQRVQLTIDFLLDGSRREEQICDNRADDTNDNLATTFDGELRSKQRFTLNGDDNNQRGISRQAPGVRVLHLHQRRDPGAKTRPDTAHNQHQQRRADHQDDNGQSGDTADKGADNTQHPAIANCPGVRFATRREGWTGGDDRGGQNGPARCFKLEMEANKQRQHNGACQLHGEADVLAGDGKNAHSAGDGRFDGR